MCTRYLISYHHIYPHITDHTDFFGTNHQCRIITVNPEILTFFHPPFVFHIAIVKPSLSPSYKILLVRGAAGSRQSHQTKYCAWWLDVDQYWQHVFLIFLKNVHHMAWFLWRILSFFLILMFNTLHQIRGTCKASYQHLQKTYMFYSR